MATDLERLVVQLSADVRGYENAMRRAQGVTVKQTRSIERTWANSNKTVSAGFAGLAKGLAGAFAAAASLRGVQQLLDSSTKIQNALKVTGLEGDKLTKVYDALYLSAQRNAVPIEDLVTLYSRASMAAANLGASQEDLGRFVENVAVSLRVSGKTAQEASGALLQLSQVLGGSVVQAQEYNSLIDGAYPLLQAVAAGLKEASGDVGKLTQLVKSGSVPTRAFFEAFQVGSVILKDKVASSVFTIGQRLTNLRTAMIDAAGRFNESSKAANTFGSAIDNVTSYVSRADFGALVEQIATVIKAFQDGVRVAQNFANGVAEASGLDNIGALVTGGSVQKSFLGGALTVTSSKALRDRVDAAFEQQVQEAGALTVDVIRQSATAAAAKAATTTGRLPEKAGFTPVSLDDPRYGLPGKKKDGAKSRESDYAREIAQIKERTAAIQATTVAQAGLNPLIDDYGFAVEKAAAVEELLTAAQKSGLTITPELRAQIESLATAYAQAGVAAEQLSDKQEQARQTAEFFADTAYDAFSSLIPAIETGNAALDKLLNTLVEAVAQAALLGQGPLASLFGGGGAGFGGLLGGLFGFAGGGYTGNGGRNQPKGVVHGGEFVFSKAATQRAGVGNLNALHRNLKGYADGGLVAPTLPNMGGGGSSRAQNIVITLVGEEGEMFTPRVREISGQTAGVVVQQARPQLAQEAVRSVQSASRNRPGYFR